MEPRFAAGRVATLCIAALIGCSEKEAPPPPPPAVKVATVLEYDVPVYVEAIGQTRGSTEIEVRARVEGFLESIHFQEGRVVQKDQLLYTIDSAPFKAALAEAKGTLAESEANLARARQDVARYEPLVAKNAISRQEYETAVAVAKANEASVEAANAVVERARIDLGYTRVTAPDTGLAGKTEVYPGTLVGRGQSTLLTRISQIDTIHVRVGFSETDYLHYARKRGPEDREEDPPIPFELFLADGSAHSHPGKRVFVDRNVDPETGTILLEAAFPNPDRLVRPGQYARVRARVEFKKGAILVPQRAVQELQGIYSVAVVKPDDVVDRRVVAPAERIGSLWVIDSGLRPGERIVVEGLQKVRPGVKVAPETVTIDPPQAARTPAAAAQEQPAARPGADEAKR